jgi:hypothetical protein
MDVRNVPSTPLDGSNLTAENGPALRCGNHRKEALDYDETTLAHMGRSDSDHHSGSRVGVGACDFDEHPRGTVHRRNPVDRWRRSVVRLGSEERRRRLKSDLRSRIGTSRVMAYQPTVAPFGISSLRRTMSHIARTLHAGSTEDLVGSGNWLCGERCARVDNPNPQRRPGLRRTGHAGEGMLPRSQEQMADRGRCMSGTTWS